MGKKEAYIQNVGHASSISINFLPSILEQLIMVLILEGSINADAIKN